MMAAAMCSDKLRKRFGGWVVLSDHSNAPTGVPGREFGRCPNSILDEFETTPCFSMVRDAIQSTPITASAVSNWKEL